MPPILTDIRPALRALRRTPGFTVTAIATLGLGMALCATALAVLDAYLLRGFPYPHAERLYWVQIGQPNQAPPRGIEARDWKSLDDVVERHIAWDLDMFYMVGREHTTQAPGAWVTPGFMDGFGIRPAIGAGFDAIGAGPGRITRLFLGQGSRVLATGLAFGLAGALVTGRLLESQLVGVATYDPLTLVSSSVAFAAVALAAMWWPSRRAAATDPATALRAG